MATKKWQESDFCKMSPVHSADTLRVRHFVEITLSHTISKMNTLLRFTQKFKRAAKSGWKAIFAKKSPVDSAYILWDKKFCRNRCITHCFRVFLMFHAEIQDGRQKWRESDFCKKSPVHSGHPGGRKFRQNRSCTIKEIEANLCFSIFGKNSKIQNGRHFFFCQDKHFIYSI